MKKTITLADMLNYLLRKNNLRPSQLAQLTGVPQPTVHRMVAGTCPRPHKSSLQPIAKYFDLSLAQIKGEAPIAGLNMHKLDQAEGWAAVPLVEWQHLTTWLTTPQPTTITYTDATVSTKAFAAYLLDDSMAPLFPERALAIFDPEHQIDDGSFVLIRLENGTLLMRRLLIKNAQRYYIAVNPQLSPQPAILNATDKIIAGLVQVRIDY